MAETIGFIGLGRMGMAMARNLLAAGFVVRAYNRTKAKARELATEGAIAADHPQDVAARGGVVVTMVANDAALEQVAGDALAQALGPGGLHISMSTVSPKTNARLAEHHAKFGVTLIAAPVFGRPEAAAERKLVICTSGDPAGKRRGRPVLEAMGSGIFDFGDAPGAANVVKLAGNFLLTAAIEAMAEAAALAEKNGVPRDALLNMFTQTLFNCPIYNNYAKRLIDADFDKAGFALRLALKDMTLAHDTAGDGRVPMPILSLLLDRYVASLAKGRDGFDASAIALEVAEDAGLKW